jgi:hypothetical protein
MREEREIGSVIYELMTCGKKWKKHACVIAGR